MMRDYATEYADHLAMWGPHCGAPKSVYKGHLDILIAAAVAVEREECAKVAENESHCHESARSGKACGCVWCACAVKLAAAIRARGGR